MALIISEKIRPVTVYLNKTLLDTVSFVLDRYIDI